MPDVIYYEFRSVLCITHNRAGILWAVNNTSVKGHKEVKMNVAHRKNGEGRSDNRLF